MDRGVYWAAARWQSSSGVQCAGCLLAKPPRERSLVHRIPSSRWIDGEDQRDLRRHMRGFQAFGGIQSVAVNAEAEADTRRDRAGRVRAVASDKVGPEQQPRLHQHQDITSLGQSALPQHQALSRLPQRKPARVRQRLCGQPAEDHLRSQHSALQIGQHKWRDGREGQFGWLWREQKWSGNVLCSFLEALVLDLALFEQIRVQLCAVGGDH